MKQQEITVTIDKDGNTEIEGHNFVGRACEQATKFLEKILGKVLNRQSKSERYKFSQQNVRYH